MRFPTLTAGALKAALEKLPPETPVVLSGGSDHTYMNIRRASKAQAGLADGTFHEWFGAQCWDDDSPPVDVVVLE